MKKYLASLGTVVAYVGMIVCLAAVAGRFYGAKTVLGYQAVNFFMLGIGLMVWSCWAKLESR
ncbi:MAG TPA: hypothetical protein VKA63_08810 [Candidatus Krumholzibacteria bacterium]|nr:hypothetical protein [Candidatus Krumholzibacteria bacterium]